MRTRAGERAGQQHLGAIEKLWNPADEGQPGPGHAGQRQVIALLGAVAIHRGDEQFARAQLRGARSDRLPRTNISGSPTYGRVSQAQTLPGMQRTQERILEPLSPEQRRQFMELLQQLVTANNDLSRAPSERPR